MKIRDARTSNRFFVDNAIISEYGQKIGPYGIAIYAALCYHVDKSNQQCFPSYATIAKEIGCSRRKVQDTIALLAQAGLLSITGRVREDGSRGANIITLLSPMAQDATGVAQSAIGCSTECLGGMAPRAQQNNPNIEQSSLNNDSSLDLDPNINRLDGGNILPARSRRRDGARPTKDWLTKFEALIGYKLPNGGLEARGMTSLYDAGYTWEQVVLCYNAVKQEPFWKNKHVSLMEINKRIGAWLQANAPKEYTGGFEPVTSTKVYDGL